jgi:hypothetical protein
MTASFPGSVKSFSANQDGVTEVDALFADARDDEIEAIEGALLSVISPSQITSNQNDYSPTGLSTAAVIRITTDASRNITGLAARAHALPLCVVNIGAQNVVLKDADAASVAANRLALKADITIAPDGGAIIFYDVTSAVWRCVGTY